jgi:hypothetical protein
VGVWFRGAQTGLGEARSWVVAAGMSRSTRTSKHPELTAFAKRHPADEDDLVERLYYL